MLPEATSDDLIYMSQNNGTVSVLAYQSGKLVGALGGFYEPAGLCVSAGGDVFVTDSEKQTIFEFAHGQSNVKRTFPDNGFMPVGCAVDRASGNLAVVNLCGVRYGNGCNGGDGNVTIFTRAGRSHQTYSSPAIINDVSCDYDDNGDLYVSVRERLALFKLVELVNGQKPFRSVTLKPHLSLGESPIQWDGSHITVGDSTGRVIYEFTVSGGRGTEVGTTPVPNSDFTTQYWIIGKKVLVPAEGGRYYTRHWITFYDYPAGGEHRRRYAVTYLGGGVTVSVAPSR
jgi:hypothetical protein